MSKLTAFAQSLKGQKIAVIGMGVSNIPLIQLLLRHDLQIAVRDKQPDPEMQRTFSAQGAHFITGETYLEDLTEDVIFRTPGLSPNSPALSAARAAGKKITSEMQEFFRLCPCPVFAITGSDGKTTTSTLIGAFLEATGKRVFLGGNIGKPLLCEIDQMEEGDLAVLELSSFQLMDLDCDPTVAVVTNLSPNHLDYHHSMEEYVTAKTRIFTAQSPQHKVIFNLDNQASVALADQTQGALSYFSRQQPENPLAKATVQEQAICLDGKPILPLDKIQIKGVHNIENFMAAILAVEDFCTKEQICQVAEQFYGVEHRMQLIRQLDGVSYYNDSIGTSPTRTIAGLRSFDQRIILIAGGYDKGIPFADLGVEIQKHVKDLVLCGATAAAIETAVSNASGEAKSGLEGRLGSVTTCADLKSAVLQAKSLAKAGDAIVLSPACAAFDQFKNFAERGKFFQELVNSL